VKFPKAGFSENKEEVLALFERMDFNELQYNMKLRVLINYDETKETTLPELLGFMREIHYGQHPQYNIPISFDYIIFEQEIQKNVISNEDKFAEFLFYLYCLYRKIGIMLNKIECLDVLPDIDSEINSFEQICSDLEKAKLDYQLMDKINSLEVYLMLKRLLSCYTKYIRYSIDHSEKMDEGNFFPRTCMEIKLWLRISNIGSPEKIDLERFSWVYSFVISPLGYENVIQTLRKTTKFSKSDVEYDNQIAEPCVVIASRRFLFGFIDMKANKYINIPDNASMLEVECPGKCTQDIRRWICTKCGSFVFQKENILYCPCGSKQYKDIFLKCHNPSHQAQKIVTKEEVYDKVLHFKNPSFTGTREYLI